MKGIGLCVNIDHVATVRQARGTAYPDLPEAAVLCESAGAAGITVHLREDRRHIQDADVFALRKIVKGRFNLEMALSDDIIGVARKVVPDQITLVPERREELTTEGGLDVHAHFDRIRAVAAEFNALGVTVSLFIEPDPRVIELSAETGAAFIELHTGRYCDAADMPGRGDPARELDRVLSAASRATELGIGVNAGHGLNTGNVGPVCAARGLNELNIGHSIVARAIFVGLGKAVAEMLDAIGTR